MTILSLLIYINQLMSNTLKAFYYKKGMLLMYSIIPTVIIETTLNTDFFGLSLGFLLLFVVLIITDFLTGIIASRYEGNALKSSKITFTFFKILMYFLCFWILFQINNEVLSKLNSAETKYIKSFYYYASSGIAFIRTFIFVLISMREYISIGENIERRYHKKIYIFLLFEKVFDVLENLFIKKLESGKIEESKKSKEEYEELL